MKTTSIWLAIPLLALAAVAAGATCESLQTLSLPGTTITSAQTVSAGGLVLPVSGNAKGKAKGQNDAYKDLPSFCRVAATLRPSADSDIKIEVWMPAAGWNNKYEAVGNGGWAGIISYPAMAEALRRGYATSSTDTGHEGGSGRFALDHPEKLIDFAWRSEHEMTVKSKSIIQAFYGQGPKLSYWNGCSTGGRQGLQEAQRFPNDYDGYIVGAAANRTLLAMYLSHAVLKEGASFIPATKYPIVHEAVLKACDTRDGVKDGLLEDPTKCKFDPKVLECKGADGPSCLTSAQVEAARKIFMAPPHPRGGKELFPPLVPGTELAWGVQIAGPDPTANMLDHYKYVTFKSPDWNWRMFNFETDVARFDAPETSIVNATDPNLRPFFGHNGKMLMYHGWSDTNVPGLSSVKYYKTVVDTLGGAKKTSDSIRLFMAPGMGHCRGGEGPDLFDAVGALEQWVEQGKAPEKLIAAKVVEGKTVRTRPLCPYPQVAKYKGSGSVDEASNFNCVVP